MRSDRGAMLIMVAICLFVLTALSAIVLDQGVLYTARRQAQNAADAGALAGVQTLMLDATAGAVARDTAKYVVKQNTIWSESLADPDITISWPLPSLCPDGFHACIKVDVSRGGLDAAGVQHTNYLPTFFAQMLGIQHQGINATATAEVLNGNATNCLKPWIIPDAWQELSVPPNNQFDVGVDNYQPPTSEDATGYRASMFGTPIHLTEGDPNSAVAPSNYYEADLDGSGASNYQNNIENCVNILKEINPNTPPFCDAGPTGAAEPGCVNLSNGRKPNANINGAQALIDADPSATVDSSGNVHNSCAEDNSCTGAYVGRTFSPRIVPVALFDPAAYMNGAHQSGNLNLPIVNIMAFFVQDVVQSGQNKGQIDGVLCGDASLFVAGAGTAPGAQFLKIPGLIR